MKEQMNILIYNYLETKLNNFEISLGLSLNT
jgi:hypothetical protein